MAETPEERVARIDALPHVKAWVRKFSTGYVELRLSGTWVEDEVGWKFNFYSSPRVDL